MSEAAPRLLGDVALSGEISANLTGFCRLLRQEGVGVGPGEQIDALRALTAIDIGAPVLFRAALRAALAKSPDEQEVFDQLFARYWLVWERAGELNRQMREKEIEPAATATQSEPGWPASITISDWLRGGELVEGEEEAAGYSPFEVTTHRDFRDFTAAELPEIIALINELSRTLATRFSRRYQQSHGRGRLDLRRTLRLSLRRGGDMIDLAYRSRRRQKIKLVLLCDVSKSMDLYSRFLIQFVFGFQNTYRRIETFAFSTSLHHLTSLLRENNIGDVLSCLSASVPNWSGGTQIGHCLQDFVASHGQLVDRNTVVLVISDGWDTGDIEVLEGAMDQIQRRCRCLIWLNPLMGHPDYAPTCRGMQAALPYIDLLAAAHNVDSLRRLVRQLGKLQKGEIDFGRRLRPGVAAGPGSDSGKAVPLSGVGTTTAGRAAPGPRVAGLERLVKS